jgi:polysaccharide biosynthesis/export protein
LSLPSDASLPTRLLRSRIVLGCLVAVLAGCANLPTSGPSAEAIEQAGASAGQGAIQVLEIDDTVSRRLAARAQFRGFSESLGAGSRGSGLIGAGDSVEIVIWEAPPATLFGGAAVDTRLAQTARATTLPEQVVDQDGFVGVPFAGRVRAAGRRPHELESEIQQQLRGKANGPEVMVRITRNVSSTVTVVGEVGQSLRMPLTPGGERLLDALAAAGGVRQPVGKVTLQVTRGERFEAMPLELVIRDPRQNVPLMAGDVITALFQPLSFSVLGATGRNEELPLEAQGITLAQALARSGGLLDNRASPQGVFVFRFEAADAMDWPRRPVARTADGLVPVVYRLDLRSPAGFFHMQSFPVRHRDVLYVSNAPAAELQKFLNLIFSVVYPVLTTISITQ